MGTCVSNTRDLENDMPNEPKNFYVTLLSSASQALFPDNTACVQMRNGTGNRPRSERQVEGGLCEFSCPPRHGVQIRPVTIIGISNIIIYCNLIQPQFVADILLRCLRTIILPSLYCENQFVNIYYIPVEKRNINHIRIELKDLLGNPVTFPTGAGGDASVPVKIVLHFHRVPT